MRALYFDGKLRFRHDLPTPSPYPDEALIRTRLVGICNTDLEITRGYGKFTGVLGHEFMGEVVEAPNAPDLIGQRVVGEINLHCGTCPTCRNGEPNTAGGEQTRPFSISTSMSCGESPASEVAIRGTGHCPHRTTLGIHGRNGAMADFLTLPTRLLHPVPDSITDEQAVFVEPLAAAWEIVEQVHIRSRHRVVVLGDGKLGLLIAQVLQLTGCDLLVAGHHRHKLAILASKGIATQSAKKAIEPGADIVVEATGSPSGFAMARTLVRPRGTLVLKSTFRGDVVLDLSGVVVDEITIIGSRCGPFAPALRLLAEELVDVESLIHGRFPLDDGLAAFEQAASGALKILLST
uniref:Threonine dehydrogenase n=1 Tax=Candidatus Kentrum sp. FW TaxID=2126338 RepID=A0A450T776_9GAMM|nr:MAG: Threonine dehydrogenase [Candidatus Kentron sp. FW]